MSRPIKALAALAACMLVTTSGLAASAEPGPGRAASPVHPTKLGKFEEPVFTASPPGDPSRLFVVEKRGVIRVIDGRRVVPRPFLDISRLVADRGERGLLSMAFSPGYERTGRFFVLFTGRGGNIRVVGMRVSERNPLRAERDLTGVISIPHPNSATHNGGQVSFGPDGNMWLATGDGGGACDPDENAQSRTSLLGKLLRIDPLRDGGYAIPGGNPFVDTPGADEIYATGLRNPYRFSFDFRTGTIAIGDVGQEVREEINYETLAGARGANFGWDAYEGSELLEFPDFCANDEYTPVPERHEAPVLDYEHVSGDTYNGCAVTGGLIVRDPRLQGLFGRYLYSDVCKGQLRSAVLEQAGATDDAPVGPTITAPTSIRADGLHRIYVTSLVGQVYRLDPAG